MVTLPDGDWLTVKEAANALDVSIRRVQALIAAQKLTAQKLLGRYVVSKTSVVAYKRSPRKAGRPKKDD